MAVLIPTEVKRQVLEKEKACAYCGRPVSKVVGADAPYSQRWRALDERGVTFHFDHKVPLAAGGTNSPENICLACPECNLVKARTHDKRMVRAGKPAMTKLIKVSDDVYDRLVALKTRGETFDLLIADLLAMKQKLSEIMPK